MEERVSAPTASGPVAASGAAPSGGAPSGGYPEGSRGAARLLAEDAARRASQSSVPQGEEVAEGTDKGIEGLDPQIF